MININETLLNKICPHLYKYNCDQNNVECFLANPFPFLERQRKAIHIIEKVITARGKKELLRHVVELARIEYGIRELEPQFRDHVVHAVLSFVLGIYINEEFLRPTSGTPVDVFQWELAGLFHDIGYPVQIANDITKPFGAKINDIKKSLGSSVPDIHFKIVPVGLQNLTNGKNSFELIQERLNKWGLKINAKGEYTRMIASGNICHGVISSLALLYIIDLMYQRYNPKREYLDIHAGNSGISWNQTYFENDIISASSAIFIHNLPSRCFENAKINRSKAPVAYLLKLSDCLQEWERPSLKIPDGFSATEFDIMIHKKRLILQSNIPNDKKNKIKEDIYSSLAGTDVDIY